MKPCNFTDEQIEIRLNMVEGMMAKADPKDLPSLNRTFQRLIDEQVRRDLKIPRWSATDGSCKSVVIDRGEEP